MRLKQLIIAILIPLALLTPVFAATPTELRDVITTLAKQEDVVITNMRIGNVPSIATISWSEEIGEITIAMDKTFLEIASVDDLATVIGHELAHIDEGARGLTYLVETDKLQILTRIELQPYHILEIACDIHGAMIAQEAGYEITTGVLDFALTKGAGPFIGLRIMPTSGG